MSLSVPDRHAITCFKMKVGLAENGNQQDCKPLASHVRYYKNTSTDLHHSNAANNRSTFYRSRKKKRKKKESSPVPQTSIHAAARRKKTSTHNDTTSFTPSYKTPRQCKRARQDSLSREEEEAKQHLT